MHPAHVKRKENGMKIELQEGAVRLSANQTLKVHDGAGRTVCALEGAVWITEEDQAKDIVLEHGACYRLRNRGLALVNALGGAAAVSFA
jgi:ferric-dicitrate binding protein FerR (iron transport regulator)